MLYKAIFQGRLDYATERAYRQMKALYMHRIENYYKREAHFKPEQIFDDELYRVVIPRTVVQLSEKYWKNTVNLLKLCADYAVAGYVGAWMVQEGKILHYAMIEPTGDKVVVREFNKALSIIGEKGREKEALERLNKAISKYDKHSMAYERRGYVNFILKQYEDARYDFDKSIRLDENNALAYFGRGNLNFIEERWEDALMDFTMAMKKSIALQPLHWQARLKKAETHMQLKQYSEAERELKLFIGRHFTPDNVNYQMYNYAVLLLAKALLEQERYHEVLQKLRLINPEERNKKFDLGEMYFVEGLARYRGNLGAHVEAWQKAVEHGYALAEKWLEERAPEYRRPKTQTR